MIESYEDYLKFYVIFGKEKGLNLTRLYQYPRFGELKRANDEIDKLHNIYGIDKNNIHICKVEICVSEVDPKEEKE